MMAYRWANPERVGVIAEHESGRLAYIDGGEAYDALLSSGVPIADYVEPTAPSEPTPEKLLEVARAGMMCSRFQARAALHLAGLLPAVEATVADADPLMQLAWADAVEFRRDSPTIAAIAAGLDLTDEQVDELFRAAMQITA